mgnify:CR=1 FL=1
MEKYLIVGTGGVGGSIAGFLALAGKDVTCIARGKHLEAIREKGLHLRSDLKGNHFLPIQACTAEEYNEKANVIFVCVKGYSLDSIKDLLEKASDKDTLIIPILNVYGTGPRIGQLVPHVTVLDGCIYIVGFVSGPVKSHKWAKYSGWFSVHIPEQGVALERLETIADVLEKQGSKPIFRMISIATPSSNGHSSRLWPAQVPTMMSRWVLCNIPEQNATLSSVCPRKVLK